MHQGLLELFKSHFGEEVTASTALRPHASDRKLYRLVSANHSAVGIHYADFLENRAFVEFSRHFRTHGLPVPAIYAADLEKGIYLEEDLGDTTLFDLLKKSQQDGAALDPHLETLYRRVIEFLPRFQVQAGRSLDYSLCYYPVYTPATHYDRKAMLFDARSFRDNFLRRSGIRWNQTALENDFERFINFLAEAPSEFFMYRDFQSRNIMIKDGQPHFIDYQNGTQGPLQYDLAALLYQSRAALPAATRQMLLNHYLESLKQYLDFDREQFLKYFHGFVYIRLMQVLGVYGAKGLGEKREYFLKSIPYAIRTLKSLLDGTPLPFHLPALSEVFHALVHRFGGKDLVVGQPLKVDIYSFSYLSGIPRESSEHGGGFVFDCRCLPNPGREAAYRTRTGLDADVIEYFAEHPEVDQFLEHIFALVDQAVASYLARGFVSLTVCFGCTGGQHRSVFSAERLARYLREKFQIEATPQHISLERNGFLPRRNTEHA